MAVVKKVNGYKFKRYGRNPYIDEFLDSKENEIAWELSDASETIKFYQRLMNCVRIRKIGNLVKVHRCVEDNMVGLERVHPISNNTNATELEISVL